MTRRRSACLPLSVLILLVVASLVLIILVGIVFSLPERAAKNFGPASPRLNPVQTTYLSAMLLWRAKELSEPVNPLGEPKPFHIELGETLPSIATRLQEQGLIRDADAFLAYLQYAGLDNTLQAGDFTLSPALSSMAIAHLLQDATPKEVTFIVLAGWRREEIAAALPTSGLEITPAEFLAASRSIPQGYPFLKDFPPGASLEGFLFPGEYRLRRDSSPEQVIALMLDRFVSNLTPEMIEGFARQGLNIFEAVTLASIIEREAVIEEEMPMIASVFLNRLAIGMKLDADSTVQYAIGYNEAQQTWWTNPLSLADLSVPSAYNTYQTPGLPPGPIANPGINALRAVAFPAQTPYYYFRAACDGSGRHVFAITFEEHKNNACP